jgi:hypothetical protein
MPDKDRQKNKVADQARGARTHACRVETHLDAWSFAYNPGVEISLDAARMSACATLANGHIGQWPNVKL